MQVFSARQKDQCHRSYIYRSPVSKKWTTEISPSYKGLKSVNPNPSTTEKWEKKYRKEVGFLPITSVFECCNTEQALNLSEMIIFCLWDLPLVSNSTYSQNASWRRKPAGLLSKGFLSQFRQRKGDGDWFHMLTIKTGEGEQMGQAEK